MPLLLDDPAVLLSEVEAARWFPRKVNAHRVQSVMALDRNPVQLAWRLEGRLGNGRERDKDVSIHTEIDGALRETISFSLLAYLLLANCSSFSGMRFPSNSRWEQRMSSLGWAGKTLPQPAVKIWWWAEPVFAIPSLCPFSAQSCPLETEHKHQGMAAFRLLGDFNL